MADQIALGDYPLNGGFETQLNPDGLPDHWLIYAGELDTDIIVHYDTDGVSGGRYIEIVANDEDFVVMASAVIPIINEAASYPSEQYRYGGLYRLKAWVRNDEDNVDGNLLIAVGTVDYTGDNTGGFMTAISHTIDGSTKVGHWQLVEKIFALNDMVGGAVANDSLNAYVFFASDDTSDTARYHIDEIRLQYLGSPWYVVGDTTKFTDNYEPIPDFDSGWDNYDVDNWPMLVFRRDEKGRVWVHGMVGSDGSATSGTPVFNLPPGFRPDVQLQLSTQSSGSAAATIWIHTNGDVEVYSSSTMAVMLTFSFDTYSISPFA
jgi:hypothetical protein